MESVLEAPTAPQAETPAEAPPEIDVTKDLERLHQMDNIGQDVKKTRTKLLRQQTEEAKAESHLKDERAKTRTIENTLEELLTDLSTLAAGGSIERLPFGEKSGNGQAAAPASPDAWKSVPLADVWRESGANVALLALLMDGKVKAGPQKNQVANLRTLGDLAAFTSREHAKLTDISGIGPEKANAIEDVMLCYWRKHPQPAAAPAPAASGLDWKAMSDAQHFADTRSGIKVGEGKSTPQFVVSKDGDRWDVGQSSGPLMPAENPGAFDSIEGAKDWCEKREAELCAKAEYVPTECLKWEQGESEFEWTAYNTAGIKDDDDVDPLMFRVTNEGGAFKLDFTDDALLPINFPDQFDALDPARSFCEARNRELCLKAREQMPELYDDKPAKKAKPKAKKTPKRKTVVKK